MSVLGSRVPVVRYGFVSLVLVCLLALTAIAEAQDRGGRSGGRGFGRGFGFGRGLDKVTLLGSEQVRKELKISEEQAPKIDEILAAYRTESREVFSGARGGRDLSPEERRARFEEARKKIEALRKKTEAKLAEVLTKDQVKRLEEILLQQQGVEALQTESVAAALKLSDEQKEKIAKVFSDRDAKIRELFEEARGSGGGFREIREKSQAIREEAEKAALSVLTEEQRKAFEKLKGKPFELDRRSLFRGRFGGGREGGGRGGRGGEGRGEGRPRRRPAPEGEEI